MGKTFNNNTWVVQYRTKDGFEGEIALTAFNRIMAYELFEEMAKDFDDEVVAADAIRVDDDYDVTTEN